jgi:hypothetical protein
MVGAVDPVAEDMNGLGLAAEGDGELLGDERVGQMIDRQRSVDRVVVGDRHEVHPLALGQLIDLPRLGRALRKMERTLDAELRQLRCRRVHMHVSAAVLVHGTR